MTPTHPKANMRTCRFELSPAYAHLEEFCKNIAQEFAQSNATIHRARNELKTLHVKGEALVVKSFKVPNLFNRIVYTFFRKSKAEKSFKNAQKLLDLGICTPEPIAYIEFFKNGLLHTSYFIAKEWPYDFTIREPLLEENFPDKEIVLNTFAHFVHTLHHQHITHKDLSPGNVLIRRENLQMCVVDINRMGFSSLNMKQKLVNFSKLWAKDEDLEKIITAYADKEKIDVQEANTIALHYSQSLKRKKGLKRKMKALFTKRP